MLVRVGRTNCASKEQCRAEISLRRLLPRAAVVRRTCPCAGFVACGVGEHASAVVWVAPFIVDRVFLFGNQDGFKAAVAVAGPLDADRAVFGQHGLGASAIALIRRVGRLGSAGS